MPVRLPPLPTSLLAARLFQSGARRLAFVAVVATLFLLAFLYHALNAVVGVEPPLAFEFVYTVTVLVGYAGVFVLMSRYFERRRFSPVRVFWSCLLAGMLLLVAGAGVYFYGSPPSFVTTSTGTVLPATLGTALKVHVLGFLEACFGFVLLLHLRALVLYRRTRTSVRNWIVLLFLMTAAGLSMFMADDIRPVTIVLIVATIVAAVVNSFRLSWIVYLTFRQKAGIIGLSTALIALLGFVLFDGGFFDRDPLIDFAVFGKVNSYPVNTFVMLCVCFGLLYSATTFLSMLFHLPTTSDFQQKAGELAAMHSVSRLTGDVFDKEKLFATITASPVEAGTAQSAWLAMVNPRSGSLRPRVVATHNLTPAQVEGLVDTEALYEEVQQRSTPLMLNQASADHRVHARPGDGIESLLVVPLVARAEVMGALLVAKEVADGFEKDDVETIQTFADQAALALDNARLFGEQIERERLARELAIAREVQQKLLPQALPAIDGVSLAASSVSALEVGGDYFDIAQLGANRYGFIVGDVSGKGTSAAFYMAELKGIFQSLSRMTPTPASFLAHANHALVHSLEKNTFISVVYGILDLNREVLTLARAGHVPAILVRTDGEARFLRTGGMGLGLDPGPLFEKTLREEVVALEVGDTFVFYTDGVVESRNPGGEEYGFDRLLDVAQRNRRLDAEALHAAILDDLCIFIDRDEYDDDLTLLVLKWNGQGASGAPRPARTSMTDTPAHAPVPQDVLPTEV